MTKRFAIALAASLTTCLTPLGVVAQQTTTGAQAQGEVAWIQVEAQPNLTAAEDRVRAYAARMEGVNGFRIGANWYAIVLGPYSPDAAALQLRSLKNAGIIPRDSFIAETGQFRQQFWPVGANALTSGAAVIQTPVPETEQQVSVPVATVEPAQDTPAEPEPPRDETKREAQKSERLLNRDERKALQVALQWEGFYTSTIDGAFGRGTRRSMAAWQTDRGYDPTGILTTRQRAELLDGYQAVIDGLGLTDFVDETAGIASPIPGAMVKFARYEAPFLHFDTKDDSGAKLVMISQSGDQNTLFGLYDILQTLEIVPADGPRKRGKNSFTIEGENDQITSFTQVKLSDGTVKGFTLVWPKGDNKRRNMVLTAMRKGFKSTSSAALADNAGLDQTTQSLDLISGLEIRRPVRSRSGFYVDGSGSILTTAEAVNSCGRITINDDHEATVKAVDEALGLALLTPTEPLAPIAHAAFLSNAPRLNSDVAVAGYSFEGRLNAPSLTFGKLSELTGLNGEAELTRLALAALPGDAGGPVLDAGGAVMGMLLPAQKPSGRALPGDVSFALQSASVSAFLTENGVTAEATDVTASMDPIDLSAMAADMTVLVSCWE
ncbi:serine protease [Aliiroseovarius marinus]|uniref:serine protease n=1 Tax=Aliiroseovarius marinus TaxID=2500159 RepID=UPI003D7C55E6